jgi:two-component system phosphate regulon sensor histidine kinase PhoR
VRDEGERRAYLGRLSGEAVRLSMLIENVLDLGRLERGERPHDPRPLDVAALVRDVVRLFAPLAERDGVRVELRGCEAPVPADADGGALRQALLNVLDNARKYAGDGKRIEVAVRTDVAGGAVVAVRDFGEGVADDEREAVFERFTRGRRHRHGSVPGVGLGLHLARAIARRHGGELLCVAPPDGERGACFELRLPAAAGAGREENAP